MGASFWILFVIQVVLLVFAVNMILKVEKERPTESIVPATDKDIEIF